MQSEHTPLQEDGYVRKMGEGEGWSCFNLIHVFTPQFIEVSLTKSPHPCIIILLSKLTDQYAYKFVSPKSVMLGLTHLNPADSVIPTKTGTAKS
jgi:hypothetical protein